MLSMNLSGFFYTTPHAIRAMERQGKGHIVQITTPLVDQANSKIPSVLASLTKGGLAAASLAIGRAAACPPQPAAWPRCGRADQAS